MRGDGRWKLYGSWGIFYDVFKYSLLVGFGGQYSTVYRYTLDTYNWPTLVSDPACPPACPGSLISSTVTSANAEVPFDPDIRPMRSQEAVVGIEHQVTANVLLTGRYVHKQLDRAIDDIGALDANNNEIYTVGNPGYGVAEYAYPGVRLPKAVRDYDAIEVGVRRLMKDGWTFYASYLWSRLDGNYSGLSQSDENGRVAPNVGRVYDNAFVMFDEKARPVYGPLATDRPHQFKGQVVYQTSFHLSIGVFEFAGSGLPVTREVAVVQGSLFPVMYRGRLSDGRTPMLSQTDIYVQQDIGVWGSSRLSFGLSVTNLFDQDATISKYQHRDGAGLRHRRDAGGFLRRAVRRQAGDGGAGNQRRRALLAAQRVPGAASRAGDGEVEFLRPASGQRRAACGGVRLTACSPRIASDTAFAGFGTASPAAGLTRPRAARRQPIAATRHASAVTHSGNLTALALVPPAHALPIAFQYIARSTASSAPLSDSITAPNCMPSSSASETPTATSNRLDGCTV